MHAGEGAASLSPRQKRHVLIRLKHADELLSNIESILNAAASLSPFPKYVIDVTPVQGHVVLDYIARIRAQLLRAVEALDLEVPDAPFGAIRSIRVNLSFVRISLEEIRPKYLEGYGPVPEALFEDLHGLSTELAGLVNQVDAYVSRDPNEGLQQRLERLGRLGDDGELAAKLDSVIRDHGLVEFRTALASLVNRLTSPRFEIAFFGQVSCGKSSLLNHIVGVDLLPVGVRPMTAVPTRLVHGDQPLVTVSFAGSRTERFELGRLADFVTEDANPGNYKAVTSVVVSYSSERLGEGVVLVDTPGLGSLATSGAAETRAYLPNCDLGVVLINAGAAAPTEADVEAVRALYEAGAPTLLVLSKSDLLTPEERTAAAEYVQEQMLSILGVRLEVTPVSTRGEAEQLLQRWFEETISPLYNEHRRLARESVRRKLGALSEAVAAALRSKLAPFAPAAGTDDRALRAAEQRLRRVSAQLSKTEKACLDTCDALRHAPPGALKSVAEALVEHWRFGGNNPAEVVESALLQAAAAKAGAIRGALLALREELVEALREVSGLIGEQKQPTADDLAIRLDGLPQIDLRIEDPPLHRSWARAFGAGLEARHLRARLEDRIGQQVDMAFSSYARVLEGWFRRTLANLRSRFDANADPYRAQIERMLQSAEDDPEARRSIEGALQEIALIARGSDAENGGK